jgi:hypothetical protein
MCHQVSHPISNGGIGHCLHVGGIPKEWGVFEINACWKWSPGVVILGVPHSQMQHILRTLKYNHSWVFCFYRGTFVAVFLFSFFT